MKKVIYLLLIVFCFACSSQNTEKERIYNSWDKEADVKDAVRELSLEDVMVHDNSSLYVNGNYILIVDHSSMDNQIFVIGKNDFHYAGSFAHKGGGPNEITNIGDLAFNESQQLVYITDFGKQKILSCNIDSVLMDSSYTFKEVASLEKSQFPSEYTYINDTLCVGRFIFPIGNNNYRPQVAKWNMLTGEYKLMGYEHPGIESKRMTCAVSAEKQLYAECYSNHDLLTIGDFDGNLKCNIYGPKWKESARGANYYGKAVFRNNQIIVPYSGGSRKNDTYEPTKFHVFDIDGNYLKTLNIGYKIIRYCYDKDNDRLIMCFNDEIQFGYLDLKDLI